MPGQIIYLQTKKNATSGRLLTEKPQGQVGYGPAGGSNTIKGRNSCHSGAVS
jgi:hypothetical protein